MSENNSSKNNKPSLADRKILAAHNILTSLLLFCLILGIYAQIARINVGRSNTLFDGDGFYYYVYLTNLFYKGDLDFSSAYSIYQSQGPMWSRIVPETGRWSNVWSIGPSIMWLPGFLLGHTIWFFADLLGYTTPTDGFDLYHQGGAALASIFWSLLSIVLTYKLCRKFADHIPAALGTVAIWLGTPLLAYGFLEIDMSHGLGVFPVTALLLASFDARNKPAQLKRWIYCGIFIGLAALIRYQHALLLIIPVGTWLLTIKDDKNILKQEPLIHLARLGIVPLMAIIVFIPQLLAWKAIFGHYILNPHPTYFTSFSLSQLIESLVSLKHGYFSWTPLWALALLGILTVPRHFRWMAALIVLALGAHIIANAWAADWSGGESFGARRLIELGPGLAVGLASLFTNIKNKFAVFSVGLITIYLIYWNLALMLRYYLYAIPHISSPPVSDFFRGTLFFPIRYFFNIN